MQGLRNGSDLRMMRTKANVKALDVALRLGWSPSKLSLIERGYRKIDEETSKRIEQVIGELAK